jgi:hypothetical protein
VSLSVPFFAWSETKEKVLATIVVHAGAQDRKDTPIRYPCRLSDFLEENSLLESHRLLLVERGESGSTLPVQWDSDVSFSWEDQSDAGALVWIWHGSTRRGSSRTYDLVLRTGKPPAGPYALEDSENRYILVRQASRRVLKYNYGIIPEKEGQKGPYDRSCYVHPIWSPTGKVITGDFSPEHIHQRGLYMAWRPVRFGDVKSEFWGLGEATGRILTDKSPDLIQGPVFAGLAAHNKGTVQGSTYFREIWKIRLYALPPSDIWLFDLHIRQAPVDPERPDERPSQLLSMELEKLYYGGMSFRATSDWLRKDARDVVRALSRGVEFSGMNWLPENVALQVLTSEGKDRTEGDRTRARWIDYTGPLGGEWGGIAMFDHPSNLRYPTPLRIHPDLPYYSWAFVQNEPYTIRGDEPLQFLYRAVVHNGRPDIESNERLAADFVEPPRVEWQPRQR